MALRDVMEIVLNASEGVSEIHIWLSTIDFWHLLLILRDAGSQESSLLADTETWSRDMLTRLAERYGNNLAE
jgi:hypothetical protein